MFKDIFQSVAYHLPNMLYLEIQEIFFFFFSVRKYSDILDKKGICACVHMLCQLDYINFNNSINLITDYIISYFCLTLSYILWPNLLSILKWNSFITYNLYTKVTYISVLYKPIFSSLFLFILTSFHVLYCINVCMST